MSKRTQLFSAIAGLVLAALVCGSSDRYKIRLSAYESYYCISYEYLDNGSLELTDCVDKNGFGVGDLIIANPENVVISR